MPAIGAMRAGVFPETTRVLISRLRLCGNRFRGRSLLDDHVGVGAADAERRHARRDADGSPRATAMPPAAMVNFDAPAPAFGVSPVKCRCGGM